MDVKFDALRQKVVDDMLHVKSCFSEFKLNIYYQHIYLIEQPGL